MQTETKLQRLQAWIAQQQLPQALALELEDNAVITEIVLIVAQGLLCHAAGSANCTCPSCTLLSEGTHPDLHCFLDKTPTVDDVRAIVKLNSQYPTLGHGRLICLAWAEELNLNAANALLKTLEEPNPGVHFILFTKYFDSLLPTIQSRLRLLSLRSKALHFPEYWTRLCKDEKAQVFLENFFALIRQEKLPSELAQVVQSEGLLQGLEWLYLAFNALLWGAFLKHPAGFIPADLCTRYPFERYHQSIERIKDVMRLVKAGSALQPLLTIEAILIPYAV